MQISREQFETTVKLVEEMKGKLDLYTKYEDVREKEFRELEREVHRLKLKLESISDSTPKAWLR